MEHKEHITLKERFEDYDEEYQIVEYDWGEPVGEEYWQ